MASVAARLVAFSNGRNSIPFLKLFMSNNVTFMFHLSRMLGLHDTHSSEVTDTEETSRCSLRGQGTP